MKSGDAYQNAVAQAAQSIDPSGRVEVGQWVEGPDGRRDLDVRVKSQDGATTVIFECKDWTRAIGINFIDALDSKRNDVGAPLAIIASNSGFTSEALHKASRVGIPAVSAILAGDDRIRFKALEPIYPRVIYCESLNASLNFQNVLIGIAEAVQNEKLENILYDGRPVMAWLKERAVFFLSRAIGDGGAEVKYTFREPVDMVVRNIGLLVDSLVLRFSFRVEWRTQTVELDVDSGFYDHLRRKVLIGPGPTQIQVKNINIDACSPIDIREVPDHILTVFDGPPDVGIMPVPVMAWVKGIDGPIGFEELHSQVQREEVIEGRELIMGLP